MNHREYESAIEREVAMWPGASVKFGKTSKHRAATITFAALAQKVVYPTSPSNRNGIKNCLKDVRDQLKLMLATRARRKSASPPKKRSGSKARSPRLPTSSEIVARPDKRVAPLEKLRAELDVAFAENAKHGAVVPPLSLWARLLRVTGIAWAFGCSP